MIELIKKSDALHAVLHNEGQAAVAAVENIKPINPHGLIDKLSIESGINDKNGRMIKFGDKVNGLFLFDMPIDGVCDFQNGAFGVKWMRGEVEEFTPFCCTHNIKWEIADDGTTTD